MLWFVLLFCFATCFFCIAPGCCIFSSLTVNLLMNVHLFDAVLYHFIPFLLCRRLLNSHPFLKWLPFSLLTQFTTPFIKHIGGYLVEIVSWINNFQIYRFIPFLKTQVNYFYSSYVNSLLSIGGYMVEVVICIFNFLLYQFIPFIFAQVYSLITSLYCYLFIGGYFMNVVSYVFNFLTQVYSFCTLFIYFPFFLCGYLVNTVSYNFNVLLHYCMKFGIDRFVLILTIIYLLKKNIRPTLPPVRRLIQPTSQEELLCVVCFTNKKCMLLRPCNHVCLCKDCTDLLQRENELKECPLCRGLINRVERIFI